MSSDKTIGLWTSYAPEPEKKVLWPGWETVRLIGRGSFGAVYEIQRDVFGSVEKAALKVISIPKQEEDLEEMYHGGYDRESITETFREHLQSIVSEYALVRQMVDCQHIVRCEDIRYIQQDNGIGWDIYIKMELLTPLMKALPDKVSEQMIRKLAVDICDALVTCKQYDVIHRDIKPQNIFVSKSGAYKLGDFGIAKTVEKTTGGTLAGTFKFMAPEVFSYKPYGHSADIYSLGLVLYWLMNNGRAPFLPEPPAKINTTMEEKAKMRRLQGEQLPPPAHGSEELKRIVLKACAYDPKDRYATAADMLRDLKEGFADPEAIRKQEEAKRRQEEILRQEAEDRRKAEEARRLAREAEEKAEKERRLREEAERAEQARRAKEKAERERLELEEQDEAVALLHNDRTEEQDKTVVLTEDDHTVVLPKEEPVKPVPEAKTQPALKKSKKKKWWIIAAALAVCVGLAIGFLKKPADRTADEKQPAKNTESQVGTDDQVVEDNRDAVTAGDKNSEEQRMIINIAAGNNHLVALKSDGTVCAIGENTFGQCDVSDWTNIVAISAGENNTIGLRDDGTVVAAGDNSSGKCNVSDWSDIVSIETGLYHTVGVKTDGTVIATGSNDNGCCEVSDWSDIVDVAVFTMGTLGLKENGTVLNTKSEYMGMDGYLSWSEVEQISANRSLAIGLRDDGKVFVEDVWQGRADRGAHDLEQFENIVKVAVASSDETSNWIGGAYFGLTADGRVVSTSVRGNDFVSEWTDICQIAAANNYIAGLKEDGTILAVRFVGSSKCGVYVLSDNGDLVLESTYLAKK